MQHVPDAATCSRSMRGALLWPITAGFSATYIDFLGPAVRPGTE